MGIFDELFGALAKYKKVSHEFKDSYAYLHTLAHLIQDDLQDFKKKQEEIAKLLAKTNLLFVGRAGISKTKVIGEAAIDELNDLAEKSKKRFMLAQRDLKKLIKPNEPEQLELAEITALLESIEEHLLDIKVNLDANTSLKDRLEIVTGGLKEISNELYEYFKKKRYGMDKKVLEEYHKIRLVRKIYDGCVIFLICPHGHEIDQKKRPKKCPVCGEKVESVYEYSLDEDKLSEFQKESKFLNSHNDKNNHVVWRNWWRNKQVPEKDISTGYHKLHVNVWVQLYGRKTKNIHLLVA